MLYVAVMFAAVCALGATAVVRKRRSPTHDKAPEEANASSGAFVFSSPRDKASLV